MRKKMILFSVFFTILLASFFFVFNNLKTTGKTGEFVIAEGVSGKEVFIGLAKEGYIRNADISYYYSRFIHPSSFKSGEYILTEQMDLATLIDYLSDSKNVIVKDVTITFPEGDWLKDFARKISEVTNLEYHDILTYWDNKDVVRSYVNQYPFLTDDILNENIRHPLEGYFFPDTYTFYRETSVEEVTEKILLNTQRFYNQFIDEINKSHYSTHQLFTLASIVQYESSHSEDMKNVASVFKNRLAIGMRLQSSVTVCYALDLSENDSWTECEYNPNLENPYNTYLYEGLPPGPILNPGKDAFVAVLNPNTTDYYYFMADVCGSGKVYYSKTLQEHEEYVRKYLTCY